MSNIFHILINYAYHFKAVKLPKVSKTLTSVGNSYSLDDF